MKNKIVHRYKIELLGIEPSIWRRIEVPSTYNFWGLHVAIQDAMGWLDYHLHAFHIVPPGKRKPVEIGIPDDEDYEHKVLPDWEIPISQYFVEIGSKAIYDYDFGDSWSHEVVFEGILLQEKEATYPRCIAGERACPPEDCGGIYGYYRLLEVLKKKKGEDYKEMVHWLSHHAKNYHPYHPEKFEPSKVEFWNPEKRLKMAFKEA